MSENFVFEKNSLPRHVAFIMDGNGRWAKTKGKARTEGHAEGVKVAKKIVATCASLGIPFVTLYIFSTENWKRAESEVGFLMNLIHAHLKSEFAFYKKNKIRLLHAGDLSKLPRDIQNDINDAILETSEFSGTTLTMAINYGGRDEIVRACKKMILQNEKNVSEKTFEQFLDTKTVPDVDLLIRTGGEKRLSNFLLWQTSYAELIFSETLWPDYNEKEFFSHIEEFKKRNRRFGAEKSEEKL